MEIREALSIDGTENLAVLCYGVFSATELDLAFDSLRSKCGDSGVKVFKLMDDGWPNGVLLSEATLSSDANVLAEVAGAMSRMFEVGRCVLAVGMYDGAFGEYDDILGSSTAFQTYAFSTSIHQPVIALDANVLASQAWASLIDDVRSRVFHND